LEIDLESLIWQKIELSWSSTGAWPEYIELLHLAFTSGGKANESPGRHSSRWALLPALCCQAAGGDPNWTDDIAAAWLLFYIAADLMDSVEDQDEPDPWWAELGPGGALNAATGLFFGASRALSRVYQREETRSYAADLVDDFQKSFFIMSGGQHRDLTLSELTLEQYWDIAESKSGEFFALACRSGARLGSMDGDCLEHFSRFGSQLGILVQLLDDLEDIKELPKLVVSGNSAGIIRSLPVVYALGVSPAPVQNRLIECLQVAHKERQAAEEALDLIENSGVVLYLMTEIERHKHLALKSLELAEPLSPAGEKLAEYIRKLSEPE